MCLGIVAVAICGYFYFYATPMGQQTVESIINHFIKNDAEVRFTNLNLHGLFDEAEFADVEVKLHGGEVIYAKYLHAKFNLINIIKGYYDLEFAYLDSVVVVTDGAKPGTRKREFFSLYNEIYKTDLHIKDLQVKNGRLITNRKEG